MSPCNVGTLFVNRTEFGSNVIIDFVSYRMTRYGDGVNNYFFINENLTKSKSTEEISKTVNDFVELRFGQDFILILSLIFFE